MTPWEAMRLAALDLALARRESRCALRERARASAAAAAREAEDRFTAARLDAWAEFLTPTPAPVAANPKEVCHGL
jgi:hypothetical protein